MYDLLIEQMKEAEGVTEELKEQDQWEWVQRMGNIQHRAREVVSNKIIFK
ncbi:MAG: TnpV protein [Ruminococcaceae bacterium]|nr:TnpV protein [Oscillospiraceae bacterium]